MIKEIGIKLKKECGIVSFEETFLKKGLLIYS